MKHFITVTPEEVYQIVYAEVEGLGKSNGMRVEDLTFAPDGSARVSLTEIEPEPEPEPEVPTLSEFFGAEADVWVQPEPSPEPAPLVADRLYGAAPVVDDDAAQALSLLKEKGLLPGHMTPELLVSENRRPGVGEALPGNGYVMGSTPPAGHPDDPHQGKPFRRKSGSIAEFVAGRMRQVVD